MADKAEILALQVLDEPPRTNPDLCGKLWAVRLAGANTIECAIQSKDLATRYSLVANAHQAWPYKVVEWSGTKEAHALDWLRHRTNVLKTLEIEKLSVKNL